MAPVLLPEIADGGCMRRSCKSVRHGTAHLPEADGDGEHEDGPKNKDNEYGCRAITGSGAQDWTSTPSRASVRRHT